MVNHGKSWYSNATSMLQQCYIKQYRLQVSVSVTIRVRAHAGVRVGVRVSGCRQGGSVRECVHLYRLHRHRLHRFIVFRLRLRLGLVVAGS